MYMCSCTVDRQRRRTSSSELKDHFASDGSEHTSTTGGVGEEIHIRKKGGNSSVEDSKKKAAGKRVCFSTSPKRKPKPLSSSPPSKNLSQGAKLQRTSPRKKSTVPLSPVKSGGEGGRAKRERARSLSDGTVSMHDSYSICTYTCTLLCVPTYCAHYVYCVSVLSRHQDGFP